MDINERRIASLRKIMGTMSQKEFAEAHDLDASYLSQLLNGHRKLGEKAALNLELKIGLTAGMLTSPPSESPTHKAPDNVVHLSARAGKDKNFILIPHLDIAASMGHGKAAPYMHIEVIRDMTVHLDWLRMQGLTFSKVDNLAIISGNGDSMTGTFADGDALLVDRGITEVKTDAIYVFTLDGDLYIKRLQRLTGGQLRMISDNPIYPPITIDLSMIDRMHIQARVLLAWNAKKL
ncbi:peptidase [Pseudomonas sp. SbB1]|uniref:Phage repressor n=1 Tax=Pseudomonas putida (strain GB-1) TaxID=76869 RepID=B0KSE1_PSEPG|nr:MULTISPECIES: LexA family transcriptional regulator [Pseudomonas]ABY97096.1 putative phage repressor [Pseudomonas putida GB-1]MBP0707732.1 peptidase [Pseudomonas sp. T34]MCK2187173.1 LexA family transcriptional regulator [Pseudomonas sp. MB04B]MDD2085576.1 LexA family transcriptional regulator [Pseudomonas putida]MDD2095937.1 LexA family transcriptional regulator [Pseudomonas putida]